MKKRTNRVYLGVLLAGVLLAAVAVFIAWKKDKSQAQLAQQEMAQAEETIRQEGVMKPEEQKKAVKEEKTGQVADKQSIAGRFLDQINVGWNVGNALDSCVSGEFRNVDGSRETKFYETAWGNPEISKELIAQIAAYGFKGIRIPVTWYYNTYEENGKKKIQQVWMDRVKDVVDEALDADLCVILDSHHDGEMFWADESDIDQVRADAISVWTQIAETFADYDTHLAFEGFNELNDKTTSWKYSDSSEQATNELNQAFVDAVRATGGKNKERLLIVGTFLNGTADEIFDGFKLPKDTVEGGVAVDLHVYNGKFDQEIEDVMEKLTKFSQKIKAPVIIGECGTTGEYTPADYRAVQAANFVARAQKAGMKCFWWDDGKKESYGIIDRQDLSASNEEMIKALIEPQEHTTEYVMDQVYGESQDFVYQNLNEKAEVTDTKESGITLVGDGSGVAVQGDLWYTFELTTKGDGDGMRINQIAFYDENGKCVQQKMCKDLTSVTLKADADACCVKVSIYNPWGTRLWMNYEKYMQSKDLSLRIKAFK